MKVPLFLPNELISFVRVAGPFFSLITTPIFFFVIIGAANDLFNDLFEIWLALEVKTKLETYLDTLFFIYKIIFIDNEVFFI